MRNSSGNSETADPKNTALEFPANTLCRLTPLTLLLILLLHAGAGGLAAADRNMRLVFSGGGSFLPDKNSGDSSAFPYSAIFENNPQGGAAAAFDLRLPLSLEAGFRTGRSRFQASAGRSAPVEEPIDFTLQYFYGNLTYTAPYADGGMRLFAAAGLGLRRIQPPGGHETDYGWSTNFGGGLEARTSRIISIRVELRDFVGTHPSFLRSLRYKGLVHDIQPSISLVIHLHGLAHTPEKPTSIRP